MTSVSVTVRQGKRARYGMARADLDALVAGLAEPPYRAEQIWRGLYTERRPLESLTVLPKVLRTQVSADLPQALDAVTVQRGDGGATQKWLWVTGDGAQVETVLMRYRSRATVCVSSQAGCAMACSFCATGQAGFERHLEAGEIVEQVMRAQHDSEQRVSNVVFMGMGEPLANYDAVWQATERLHGDVGISARQITISTVGVVPGMRRLAAEPLPVTLAVSLHAPDDALRDELVPLNRRYPLADVIAAAGEYIEAKGRRVSFEYVMLAGINDAPRQAQALAELLVSADLPVTPHVNLIPYNPTPGLIARATRAADLQAFAGRLRQRGISATVRRNRGTDIDAACGQLRHRMTDM